MFIDIRYTHNVMTELILNKLGVMSNIMDKVEIAATLHEACIGNSQWRKIVKFLETYLWFEKDL